MNRFFSLLLLAIFTSSVAAQDRVRVQFLAFPHQEDEAPLELLIGDKQTIKIQTPGNALSQPYTLPKVSSFVVGKTVKNTENVEVFESYGSATSLSVNEQIVLLLRKGQAPSDGFVVIPVDAAQTNFKGASYLFINTSSYSVGTVVGDQKFALKPSQRKLVEPKANHPDGICQVTFSYLKGDRWKTVYDTRWPASDKFRSIVFFFQHPQTGRLGVAPIVDVLPYRQN